MKKLTVCLFAVAAMALAMTSCNKEENVAAHQDINVSFEDNEILNEAKTHLDGYNLYWDEGDMLTLVDGSRNAAYYKTHLNGSAVSLSYVRAIYGTFDETDGTLYAFYPTTIGIRRDITTRVNLPATQYSEAGELNNFPMYAAGTLDNFQFRNICGVIRFTLQTTNQAIDSITITTEKYLNGTFSVNLNNTNPLTYYGSEGHGTKSVTLKFDEPLNGANKVVNMYLPANTYKVFDITFYSDGQAYVHRNTVDITISRTQFTTWGINLDNKTFSNFLTGALNTAYEIDEYGDQVVFAKGNIQWLAGNPQYWHIADNQWDYINRYPQTQTGNNRDRDLVAWGATGTIKGGSNRGNNIKIYTNTASASAYGYYAYNSVLADQNEWGSQVFDNGGNEANRGWRTLTADEMDYVIDNNAWTPVEISFMGFTTTGYMLTPTTVDVPTSITNKADWNTVVEAGGVFFPANYYRKASGNWNSLIPNSRTKSYYWLNTSDGVDAAYALEINGNTSSEISSYAKNLGANVRLVLDVAM